ncbi:PorP/SprF family type IX secretion system membrane protein [Fluviicola sp.]|uniref:PorP/SprF family type IX secretion system membrane protein n=1 Tax=Fluviicola sp. TaxID=1917219 RepID=UPI00281D1BAA|nr:PorP/SprF family type IX secretion system membrane protein [Fluviicola sp.]MDR0802819.1 PorP/SprF family type IX secretion system membrane protein [Fluviicola sp.]
MNLAIRTVSLFMFCLCNLYLAAQQYPVSTLFGNNLIQTNPAMTGAVYKHSANVIWRGAGTASPNLPYPTTLWANYAYRMDKINSGIGISYRYDAWGAQKRNTALLSYAYHIPIKSLYLSIGASAGINTLNVDYSGLIFGEPVPEPQFNPVFTADFGLALHHEKWNVGLSMTQLNNPTFRAKNIPGSYNLAPQFWLFADYRFNMGEKWSLTPRVQLVADRINLTTNIQVLATRKEKFWFGIGMKNTFGNDPYFIISPMVGYDIKGKFRIGYAANISSVPDAFTHNHMTSEVVLSFLMK